jgi:hypothetical protein
VSVLPFHRLMSWRGLRYSYEDAGGIIEDLDPFGWGATCRRLAASPATGPRQVLPTVARRAVKYRVARHRAFDDSWSHRRDFGDYDMAVAYAAKLSGVTLHTMRQRIAGNREPEILVSLSGTGTDDYKGVWITEIED